MSIRLNWEEPKGIFDEIQIYRTLEPFTSENVPSAPLTTLKSGSTYLDQTSIIGVLYYYTLALKVGSELIISPPQMAIDSPNVGPGPNKVVTGDRKAGWFGNLSADEIFTNAELCSLLGVTGSIGDAQTWIKGANNGKICFYPYNDVVSSITWQQLYDLGLVYGMDANGPPGGYLNGNVNQRKVVTKGNYSFLVRLMKFSSTPDWKYVVTPTGFSELRDVYFKLFNAGRGGMSGTAYNSPGGAGAWGGDLSSANNAIGFTTSNSGTAVIAGGKAWRPVLELIY